VRGIETGLRTWPLRTASGGHTDGVDLVREGLRGRRSTSQRVAGIQVKRVATIDFASATSGRRDIATSWRAGRRGVEPRLSWQNSSRCVTPSYWLPPTGCHHANEHGKDRDASNLCTHTFARSEFPTVCRVRRYSGHLRGALDCRRVPSRAVALFHERNRILLSMSSDCATRRGIRQLTD